MSASTSRWSYLTWLFSCYRLTGTLFTVFAIVCVIWSATSTEQTRRNLAAFWAIAPPIWFFLELHWARAVKPDEVTSIKESQESAEKIWAGVVAVLSVLYLKS